MRYYKHDGQMKMTFSMSQMKHFIKYEDKITNAGMADFIGLKPVKEQLHSVFDTLIKRKYPFEVNQKLKTLRRTIDKAYTSDAILNIVYEAKNLIKGLPVR